MQINISLEDRVNKKAGTSCYITVRIDRVLPSLGGMEITCRISIVPTRPFWFSSTFFNKYAMSSPQTTHIPSLGPFELDPRGFDDSSPLFITD